MGVIEYKIVPAVTACGEPTWRLLQEMANPFGVGSLKLAENPDKAVLEHAIEHLKSASSAGESRDV